MTYDVFISFKNSGKDGAATPDAAAARRVYDALKGTGLKVFFSEESLAEVGKGQFAKAIEQALEAARVLVLVASCRDHLESPWVEAEWDSFSQDIRSGNKQGELFIFNCGDLKPATLPLFLRRQQMFPEAALEKLVKFVKSAVPSLPTLDTFVQLSLHCFHPEKHEDKVYLVTVQQGSSDVSFNVTAHWGARSAKRLSSQLKAINVPTEVVRAELEKAKQEKLRGGYGPASHVGLLTSEAEAYLSASLGLTVPDTKKVVKDDGQVISSGEVQKTGPAKNSAPAKAVAVPGAAPSAQAKVVATPAKKVPLKAPMAEAVTPSKGPTAKKPVAPPVPSQPTKSTQVKALTKPAAPAPIKAGAKSKTEAKPSKTTTATSRAATPVQAPAESKQLGTLKKAALTKSTSPEKVIKAAKTVAPQQAALPKKAAAGSKPNPAAKAAAPVSPKLVCISGKLPSGKKKADYEAPLRAAGYELVDDVVKGLAFLVLADPQSSSSKSEKAKKLGISVISEAELGQRLQNS